MTVATGIDDATHWRKIAAIERAENNAPDPTDPPASRRGRWPEIAVPVGSSWVRRGAHPGRARRLITARRPRGGRTRCGASADRAQRWSSWDTRSSRATRRDPLLDLDLGGEGPVRRWRWAYRRRVRVRDDGDLRMAAVSGPLEDDRWRAIARGGWIWSDTPPLLDGSALSVLATSRSARRGEPLPPASRPSRVDPRPGDEDVSSPLRRGPTATATAAVRGSDRFEVDPRWSEADICR